MSNKLCMYNESEDDFPLLLPMLGCMTEGDRHRVYMSFMDRRGWQCQFLEEDLKTTLPLKLMFSIIYKIIELVERGGGITELADRQYWRGDCSW